MCWSVKECKGKYKGCLAAVYVFMSQRLKIMQNKRDDWASVMKSST